MPIYRVEWCERWPDYELFEDDGPLGRSEYVSGGYTFFAHRIMLTQAEHADWVSVRDQYDAWMDRIEEKQDEADTASGEHKVEAE